MRYRLRTLLIVLALGPPLLAAGWEQYARWQSRQSPTEIGVPLVNYHSVKLPPHPPEAIWLSRKPSER